METIVPSLYILLVQLPLILVWLTGLILAIIFWNRHPKVSLLALIGIVGLLIITVLGSLASLWLPTIFDQTGFPGGLRQMAIFTNVTSIVSSILSAVFWALVIAAIFGGRKKQEASQ